jgi:CubicO group peptidase (beta-lactamase class C family)
MRSLVPLAVFVSIVPLVATDAGELPTSEPREIKLSAEKLTSLKPALQKLVDDAKIPGGVALVARHGKVAYVTSFGYRDLASKTPMTDDTIFAIASMTKPITCVAVMTLVEQSKLGLDDPVAKYLPELEHLRVLGDAKDDTATELAMVPAKRPVTVRDLLSKYGLGFGLFLTPGTGGGKPVLNRYLWGGLYSTNFWIDPRHDLVAVIMTQVLPTNYGHSDSVFRTAVDAAIEN